MLTISHVGEVAVAQSIGEFELGNIFLHVGRLVREPRGWPHYTRAVPPLPQPSSQVKSSQEAT